MGKVKAPALMQVQAGGWGKDTTIRHEVAHISQMTRWHVMNALFFLNFYLFMF